MINKQSSLIVCLTPMQMLIAKKIISLNPHKNFDLLVIALNDNEKFRYYYNSLKVLCKHTQYYINKPDFIHFIKFIKSYQFSNKYSELYLASINDRRLQYIASKNKKAILYTFDDGTANINKDSIYYLDNRPNIFKSLIWSLIGVKHYTKDMRLRSKLHYTIYKNVPNVIENTKLIKLFEESDDYHHNESSLVINIYLGQPLSRIQTSIDNSYIENILSQLKIDFYFPHPRETSIPNGDFQLISSQLIIEEFIINFLKENPNTTVRLYSFISSAIINLSNIDRIEPYYIYDEDLQKKFSNLYNIANKEFNIDTIKL